MSSPYFNHSSLRLTETYKSDDTADDAQRRREMRRKQQSITAKVQLHNQADSKSLLDEVLGKKYSSAKETHSKKQPNSMRPDISHYQGLPTPARLNPVNSPDKFNHENKFHDNEFPIQPDETDNDISSPNQPKDDSIVHDARLNEPSNDAIHDKKTHQLPQDRSDSVESDSMQKKNLSNSALPKLTLHLHKLQQEILATNEQYLKKNLSENELVAYQEEKARITTSVDFLEGYAEGVITDELILSQFEEECSALRKQLAGSDVAYIAAVDSRLDNQITQSAAINSSLLRESNGQPVKAIESDKVIKEDRIRRFTAAGVITNRDKELKSARLEEDVGTQRQRGEKQVRISAESTLPLIVQRSV